MSDSNKISPVTIGLLEWLDRELYRAVDIDTQDRKERHAMLQKVWILVKEDCGFYGGRNFNLGDKGRELYKKCEHWMSVLDAIV